MFLLLAYNANLDEEIIQHFNNKNIPLKIQYLSEQSPLEHIGVVLELESDGSITLSQTHYIDTYIIEEYKPSKSYVTPAINIKIIR